MVINVAVFSGLFVGYAAIKTTQKIYPNADYGKVLYAFYFLWGVVLFFGIVPEFLRHGLSKQLVGDMLRELLVPFAATLAAADAREIKSKNTQERQTQSTSNEQEEPTKNYTIALSSERHQRQHQTHNTPIKGTIQESRPKKTCSMFRRVGEAIPETEAPAILPQFREKNSDVIAGSIALAVKTLVIGLGGLGGSAVTYLRQHSPYKFDTCVIDTNAKDLASTSAAFRILLGKNELRGLGTGIAPDISARLTHNALPELEAFIKRHGYELVITIAGGGGGTGSGALPVIAEYAKQQGLRFMPCLTMPFEFEGKKKMSIADTVQAMVLESCPNVLIVPQQPLLKEYPEARFKDALEVALFEIERHISHQMSDTQKFHPTKGQGML